MDKEKYASNIKYDLVTVIKRAIREHEREVAAKKTDAIHYMIREGMFTRSEADVVINAAIKEVEQWLESVNK